MFLFYFFYFHAQAREKWAHFFEDFAFEACGGFMFRINVYGIGLMIAAGLIVHLILRPMLPGNEPAWVVSAGLMMIVADVFLRRRPNLKGAGNRWLSGEFGATIAFPAWIMGICLIGYGAAKHLKLTD